MQIAGAWAWRALAIAGVGGLAIFLVVQLRLIVIPFMISMLLAALLVPFVNFLQRHRWPKALAVALAEIGLIVVVGGLVVLVVSQIRSGFPELQTRAVASFEQFTNFLHGDPLNLSNEQITGYLGQLAKGAQADSGVLVSGALSVGASAGHVLAGLLLTLFSTLFLLIDGRGIWRWVVRLFPRAARPAMDGAGLAGWVTLTNFVRVQIFVAAVDAVGIGAFAFFLQLPLVVPIAVAVFLGSFIPVVGAVLTGVVAVFIALIFNGPVAALVMLAGVLIVQQVEGHVLQPLVMGSAVKVHPLAVVLGVGAGGFLAGIPGALFAVPVVATVNVMANHVAHGSWRTETLSSPTEAIASTSKPKSKRKDTAE
ncbi:MAG: AI-2E family transporter [Microbacteriaceae bacterium]|nr:AI-2E family transporter [Microbacteriaceae bacterium]